MRVLVVHNYYQQEGGEETVFHSEVDLLRSNGHEVITYTRSNHELSAVPAPIAVTQTVWSQKSANEIGNIVRTTQAELVHFHNTFLRISPAAYYAVKANGAAVVQTLHNYRLICPVATFVRDGIRCESCVGKTVPWPGVWYGCWHGSRTQTAVVAAMLTAHNLLGTWSKKVDRYIALSDFSRQKFIAGGIPAEKISVKPNFVSRSQHQPISGRGNFALFAGRLSVEKGILLLLEAWKGVKNFPLKIAGDGLLREEVIKAASDHPGIHWLGQQTREEVQQLMKEAHVLIFPSLRPEGLGLSGIEALSLGLPVIAPHLGIMSEMIQDGTTGLLFQPNSVEDLAQKITWSFNHPAEIEAMRKSSLTAYEEKWSPEANYKTLMEIYGKALNQS